VKVSFLARDRERDREREFFLCLTFLHDHFGICQEYTWGRYGTLTATRQERTFHCNMFYTILHNELIKIIYLVLIF